MFHLLLKSVYQYSNPIEAAARIPMDCGACAGYLRAIEHDLSPVKIQALEKYFAFLVSRGEVPESAVPVKIFS